MTTVVIPELQRTPDPQQRLELFEKFENRFALQAKVVTVAVILSGIIMNFLLNAWPRYLNIIY